jgi:hypothetical protein
LVSLEVYFGKSRVLVLVRTLFYLQILSALDCLLLPLNVVSLFGCILSGVELGFAFPFFVASVGPPC